MIQRDKTTTIWEDRLDALRCRCPRDGGDKFTEDVYGWPYGVTYYVYEWRSFPYVWSHRCLVPQACSDAQVAVLVWDWLKKIDYPGLKNDSDTKS